MKTFNIFKNTYKKEGSKVPDYKMMASLEEKGDLLDIGGCWLKNKKDGSKYFFCVLSDAYVDHTKGVARRGFTLTMDGQTEVAENYEEIKEDDGSGIPF